MYFLDEILDNSWMPFLFLGLESVFCWLSWLIERFQGLTSSLWSLSSTYSKVKNDLSKKLLDVIILFYFNSFTNIFLHSILAPCLRNSSWTFLTSTFFVVVFYLSDIAAATPAPCPVTVQHIMFLVAAWDTISPETHRPATNKLSTSGTKQPYGTWKNLPVVGSIKIAYPSTN